MKKLLVAFDFSSNAYKALDYAVGFANRTGAEVGIIWVDNANTAENTGNIDHELRIEIRNRFNEMEQQYEPLIKHGKLDVILRKGKVYNEIAMAARKIDADIVFTGTHGVSGFEQYWIGSNAYRIVTCSPCPVITVRGDYQSDGNIRRILLPIDSTIETRQKLPFAAKIASYFDAEINLLVLFNTPSNVIRKRMLSYAEEAHKCLAEKGIRHGIKEIEAENVTTCILDYAREIDADMISIMIEQGTATTNKYLGPYAQQLINNAVVPVLSLQTSHTEG